MNAGDRTAASAELFSDLFVLELANNHYGRLDRGLKIIRDFGAVVRANGVKAAIKLQFRDVDRFVHPAFKGNTNIRYICKTESTKLTESDFAQMVAEVRAQGCIPMATPFDERSVDLCVAFDMPLIKIASSDANDWPLLEKIASTRLPCIVSSGGCSEAELDAAINFFRAKNVPLAINHCVSIYPSDDDQLEINQVDYLKRRYPDHVVGFSTHEHASWDASMFLSYAKGARSWERHIDIDHDNMPVSKYCSLPHQIDAWFKSFNKAREMCGGPAEFRRATPVQEVEYLNALLRGVYARRDLPAGHRVTPENFADDFYLAVPLRRGQLSCREHLDGLVLCQDVKSDGALTLETIDDTPTVDDGRKTLIMGRGL